MQNVVHADKKMYVNELYAGTVFAFFAFERTKM